MADLKNTHEVSRTLSNDTYDMATELFDAHQLNPMYGPGVYSAYALINGITDSKELVEASDNGDVDENYFGYYEEDSELLEDLEDAQRNMDEVNICDGHVFVL